MARLGAVLFAILLCASSALAEDAPGWLQQAAAIKLPSYDKKVSWVVLVNDSTTTVSEDGNVTVTWNYAVRILTREARDEAVAGIGYETDMGKVRELRAWMIRPSGQVKSYGKDHIVESSNLNDVYDESRVKRIVAVSDVEPGVVFGYQAVTETRPYFYQSMWRFQDLAPVVASRFSLVLPKGWEASGVVFNHPDIQPTKNGTAYSWELRDLPPFEVEPASPTIPNLVATLAVKYYPIEGTKNPGVRTFDDWSDVSRWYSEMSDAQAVPNERIAAKARELTTGAKTELDKIRAVGRYVQDIQYISIQIGVGRWRPHPAADVLAKSYGDCKDKANLMRAMLKSLDIQSYPVLIYAGDSTHVRNSWVSPGQFNHCIIAIKVSDETQVATVISDPKLGRLLIFDATDDNTPMGDLPEHEQGSFALIAAGDAGSLIRMPESPSEANSIAREIRASLGADGAMTASIQERATGQRAVAYRREFRGRSRPDYVKVIEGWVTSSATAARVSTVNPVDRNAEGKFDLDVDFAALGYGQLMQDRLLVFNPAIVSRGRLVQFTEPARRHPVVLKSDTFTETVRVKLPVGFEVDELPDALKLDAPFGSYKATYEVKDGELVYTRSLAQRASTLPAAQYQSVRTFFNRIRASEQSPVVLTKK